MLRFIWNSWWRHKERFILLIVGVMIISIGLSYLIGLTHANNGTVVDELQKRWKSSYHIVVRPPGSRSVTEDLNLLEPNYLSGLEAGITLKQYEQIKQMENVEIAAPIAMIGSDTQYVELDDPDIKEPGIYRMVHRVERNTGAKTEVSEYNWYVSAGLWQPATPESYGVSPGIPKLSYGSNVMIAGIDPEAEAALVGLDDAVVKNDNSRYFNEKDLSFTSIAFEDVQDTYIPVIVSNQLFTEEKVTYSFEKLDIPFDKNQQKIAEEIKEKGGSEYLDTLIGKPIKEFTYTTTEVHERLVNKILDPSNSDTIRKPDFSWIALKPSPVKYIPISSPFEERWPYAYQVQPYELPDDFDWITKQIYRQFNPYGSNSDDWPRLRLNYIGVFDPQKLNISKDPLTELPMETYFPAKAELVMDSENQPVNPPLEMKPTNDDYGFLTKPPLLLTTLEAASKILGDKPISAIRVNVAGVETFNEESEKLLQRVASEIKKETGLITDITLGSSPQYSITHLPGLEGGKAIGWVQQPWIKIGSSMSIFNEVKVGSSIVIFSVIVVAIVYVFSSNLIMMYARKREFAILLSLGWRPLQLSKMLIIEATLLGMVVALISWVILGLFLVNSQTETSWLRILLVGICGLLIYLLGSVIPSIIVRRIKPYEAMNSGEISQNTKYHIKAKTVVGMSLNYFFTQWKRSLLSIITIALPASLFMFFIFITFHLKGVMYATWLGQFVALEVSVMHFVAMGVAFLIAILTSTEIMWQNVTERQPQIAVLKAIGWRNSRIRLLVLSEGGISGGLAGIIGLGIALMLITFIYGKFPWGEILFIIATISVPILAGIAGALLPAEKAVRIQPYQGIHGGIENSKKTERQFKIFFGFVGSVVFSSLLLLLILSIPEVEKSNLQDSMVPDVKTEGELIETIGRIEDPDDSSEKQLIEEEEENGKFTEWKDQAWRVISLGEGTGDREIGGLFFGKMVSPPINMKPESPENKLIAIPVTFIEKGPGTVLYKPHGYKVFDEEGNKYDVKHVEKVEVGDWNKHPGRFNVLSPFEITVNLIYEVPRNHGDLILFVDNVSYVAGPVVVEIPAAFERIEFGSKADYVLNVEMIQENQFKISAEIEVSNESENEWSDIGFYFIPNVFTEENAPDYITVPGKTSIDSITESGKKLSFDLENNRLLIALDQKLKPGEKKSLKVDYTLNLPENGVRLSKVDHNYYLAQWYPMLGSYNDGWNIEDFDIKGESYDTNYGNYTINYRLPEPYLVTSSGVEGEIKPTTQGTIAGENIKDFYLAFLDPKSWSYKTAEADDTVIRVFIPKDSIPIDSFLQTAAEAFKYFEKNIGNHPSAEVDIVANDGGMEYPNIVEVSSRSDSFERVLVHELGHQWFYYLVSNDPYRDAWLDEGITEFATSIYLSEKHGNEVRGFEFASNMYRANTPNPIANIPLSEFENNYYSTIYGKVPLELKDFFDSHGGNAEALEFLANYFEEFQFEYVDTKLFSDFFLKRYGSKEKDFLESWLVLSE